MFVVVNFARTRALRAHKSSERRTRPTSEVLGYCLHELQVESVPSDNQRVSLYHTRADEELVNFSRIWIILVECRPSRVCSWIELKILRFELTFWYLIRIFHLLWGKFAKFAWRDAINANHQRLVSRPLWEISKISWGTFCRKFYEEHFCTEQFFTNFQYSRSYEPEFPFFEPQSRTTYKHKRVQLSEGYSEFNHELLRFK